MEIERPDACTWHHSGLSEPIDPASVPNATATLTPDGADPVTLTLTLAADSRTAYLTGATITAGTIYTLHVDGLTDTTHNPLWPEDATVTIADPNAYEVLDDTTAPQLLAVLDGTDALYLLFDEPVEPAAGYDIGTAVKLTRSNGAQVDGSSSRLTSQLLKWQPAGGGGGVPGAYSVSFNLTDLAAHAAIAPTNTFTHPPFATPALLLQVYAAPTDTLPEAASAYGLTTLFQGRTWHADLGAYYYRARWYLPEIGEFAERDPLSYSSSPGLYQFVGADPYDTYDPFGLTDQRARNVGGIPIPEAWYAVRAARVGVSGRTYLVSPSGTVEDEETARMLPDTDARARAARKATGWGFSNDTLGRLVSALAGQTAFLQNRWTAGFVAEIASTFWGSGFWPENGWLAGVGFQFWLNGRNQPVAAMYGIESFTLENPENAHIRSSSGRATANVNGIVLAGGVSADVAWYEHPEHPYAPFNEMSDQQIVESWTRGFREYAVATPFSFVGGSTFRSFGESGGTGYYEGVSWALAGEGAGIFRADTNFHLIDGPYNPGTLLDFFEGRIAAHDIEAPPAVKDAVVVINNIVETLRRSK